MLKTVKFNYLSLIFLLSIFKILFLSFAIHISSLFILPLQTAKEMFFIYLIIIFVTLKVIYNMKYGHRDKLLSKFPCPRKLPIIHNTLEFYNASIVDIFKWVEKQRKELGNIYYMSVHPFDSSDFIVADVKIAEAILSSQKLIDKGADYDLMKPWLGTGLLISSGKKWHQRRKVITPAFHFSILEKYVEIFETQGNIFVEKLKKYENKLVDIFPLAGLYALDVICGESKVLN